MGHKKIGILLAIVLLATPAFADDNPRLLGYPPNKIMGFRGLDTASTAPTIADGRAQDIRNVKLSRGFDLKKRYGWSVINDTLDDLDIDSPAITGIFDSEFSDNKSWTLAFVGTKLKYDNTGTWTTIAGNALTENKDYQWQCVMALDNAVCTNNEDEPIKVTSTPARADITFTGLTNAIQKAKTVVWFRNRLVWGNTVEDGTRHVSRIRYSELGNIESYDDDDYYDISTQAGDELIALVEFYGDLYVFFRKAIHKISYVGGDEVYNISKVIENIGTIARDSIQILDFSESRRAIVFLSENKKVYLFNGVLVSDLGYLIQPTLNNLNAERLMYAVSVFDGTDYYLCASNSGSSTNNICFDYQAEINEWTKHTNINANAMARVKEATSDVKTYFGNYDAFVYWLDNPDKLNDEAGIISTFNATGIVNTATATGALALINTTGITGSYTGCIVEIISGAGAGETGVVLSQTATGIVVTRNDFPLTATGLTINAGFSIGAIDALYTTKWYDFADAPRKKLFRKMFVWAEQNTEDYVTISYAQDFSEQIGTELLYLNTASSSLWDVALWDDALWGGVQHSFQTINLSGQGRLINLEFSNSGIDSSFRIYGFHLLADRLDVD